MVFRHILFRFSIFKRYYEYISSFNHKFNFFRICGLEKVSKDYSCEPKLNFKGKSTIIKELYFFLLFVVSKSKVNTTAFSVSSFLTKFTFFIHLTIMVILGYN